MTADAARDAASPVKVTKVALRPLAVPTEHGGWGFVLEPALLALLVAPSFAGILIALGVVFAFLTRHPLKFAAADTLRGRFYPRTRVCILLSAAYGTLAGALFISGGWMAGRAVVVPLCAALVPAAIQFWFDARNQSRALAAEVSGTISSVLVAAAIVLAGEGTAAAAFAVLTLALARGIPTIIFVRAALRSGDRMPSLGLHLLAILAGVALAVSGLASVGAIAAFCILFLRAYATRAGTPAKIIGMRELAYGAMFVLFAAYGW